MTIQTIPTPETIKVLASGHSQIHPTPVKSQIEDRPQKRKDCNWRKPKDLPVGFWGRDSASLMADYGWLGEWQLPGMDRGSIALLLRWHV